MPHMQRLARSFDLRPLFLQLDPSEKLWMIKCCQGNMVEMRKLLDNDPSLAEKKVRVGFMLRAFLNKRLKLQSPASKYDQRPQLLEPVIFLQWRDVSRILPWCNVALRMQRVDVFAITAFGLFCCLTPLFSHA